MPPFRDAFICIYNIYFFSDVCICIYIYIHVSVYLHLDCLYVLYIRGPYLTSVMMLVRDAWRREKSPFPYFLGRDARDAWPLRFSVSSWACGPSLLRFLQEWRRVTHRTTLIGLSDGTRFNWHQPWGLQRVPRCGIGSHKHREAIKERDDMWA